MDEEVFEVLVTGPAGIHVVVRYHAVLGVVEEVVEEVLLPESRVGGGEVAEARGEEVHVEHCYLGPGRESWAEVEVCKKSVSLVLYLIVA